jgi:teichuronic acid exporter
VNYFKNAAIQGGGNILAQFIGFILMPFLTRLYTTKDFGELNQIFAIYSFLAIVISWRYEYFITYSKTLNESLSLFKQFTHYILISFFIVSILYLSILFILEFYSLLNGFKINLSFLISPLLAILFIYSIACQNIIQKANNYSISGSSEIINKLFYFFTAFMIANITNLSSGLILATGIGFISKIIWIKYNGRNIFHSDFEVKKSIKFFGLRKMRKQALSFSISNIIQSITTLIPIFLISTKYGVNVLGMWSLSISIIYLPTSFIGSALGQVFYQKATEMYLNNISIREIWIKTFQVLILIACPIYLILAYVSYNYFSFLFGNQWLEAGKYASILSISFCFSFIATPLERTSFIVNKTSYPYFINLIRFASVLLIFIFVNFLNLDFIKFIYLYVIATSFIYIVDLLFNYYFAKSMSIFNR